MRSKISFFNKTIFLKTMARFWPLWAIYFLFWAFMLPFSLLSDTQSKWFTLLDLKYDVLNAATSPSILMGLAFGILAAMAVWSFLYSNRSASGTACLPICREGLFLSAAAAGIVPMIFANVVVAIMCALAGADINAVLVWFGVNSLILLFFYGFASFCAQLTSNIIALPVIYLALNYIIGLIGLLFRLILGLFVFGMDEYMYYRDYAALYFMPERCYDANLYTEEIYSNNAEGKRILVDYIFHGWSTVLIYAATAVALLILAFLLFRKHRMESAGDVIAVMPLKPIFRWIMAVFCGLFLSGIMTDMMPAGSNSAEFAEILAFMFVGAFIGWFGTQMLMEKSFKVFNRGWSGFLGYGVLCVVVISLLTASKADLFGYERYVPDVDRVVSVTIEGAELSKPESITQVTALHESIVRNKSFHLRETASPEYDSVYCDIEYNLVNGKNVVRSYELVYLEDKPAGDALMLQTVLNCQEAISQREKTKVPNTMDSVIKGEIQAAMTPAEWEIAAGESIDSEDEYVKFVTELNQEEAWELYSTCILPDIADGTLGQIRILNRSDYDALNYEARVVIDAIADVNGTSESYYVSPTIDSTRTNAWFAAHGIALHTVAEVAENR